MIQCKCGMLKPTQSSKCACWIKKTKKKQQHEKKNCLKK